MDSMLTSRSFLIATNIFTKRITNGRVDFFPKYLLRFNTLTIVVHFYLRQVERENCSRKIESHTFIKELA